MIWDHGGFNTGYVAGDWMVIFKIGSVGLLGEPVPLGGEKALAPDGFEAEPEPSDTSEEVDKGEWRFIVSRGMLDSIIDLVHGL